jgi:hypothetical protein
LRPLQTKHSPFLVSVSSPAFAPNDSAANTPVFRPSDAEPWLLVPTREPTAGPTFEPSLSPDASPTATPVAFLTAAPTATTLPAEPTTEQTGSSDATNATTTTTTTPTDGSTTFPDSFTPVVDIPGLEAPPGDNGGNGNTQAQGGLGAGAAAALGAGLFVLFGGVFFVRRRGNRSNEANDATAQPTDLEGGSSS